MENLGRRILFAALLATGAAIAGGWLGVRYYELTAAAPQFGYEFEGYIEQLAGSAIGLVAGAFIGFFVAGPRGVGLGIRLAASSVALLATIALVAGLAYIGDFTNADGPGSIGPYFGILLVPVGGASLVATARWVARSRPRDRD